MISISSPSFAAFCFRQWDYHGKEQLVIVVKGVFSIEEKGRFALLHNEAEPVFKDQFRGDMHHSSLLYESDIAPFKPKTDIIFNAVARSPEARLLASWPVQFNIAGSGGNALSYGFHVTGKRFFEPVKNGSKQTWRSSSVKNLVSLPIIYENAYGGTVPLNQEENDFYAFNPVGTGLLSDYLWHKKEQVRAPQIGLLPELNAMEAGKSMTVCGCGAINKTWEPRLNCAGSFDAIWRASRYPLMPKNFSYNYWNSAILPLQAKTYLKGNETVTAQGLFHEAGVYRFALPGIDVDCRIYRDKCSENLPMQMDTVYCDIASPNYAEHKVTLLWRTLANNPDDIREISIISSIDEIVRKNSANMRIDVQDEAFRQRIQKSFEQFKLDWASVTKLMAGTPLATVWGGGEKVLNCFHDEKAKAYILADNEEKLAYIGAEDFKYAEDLPKQVDTAACRSLMPSAVNELCIIYVRLLGEPVPVWRPVNACWHENDCFYILAQDMHGEKWEFRPDTRVVCKLGYFNGQYFWVAERQASEWYRPLPNNI